MAKDVKDDSKEKAHSTQQKAEKAPEKKIIVKKLAEGVRGIIRISDTDVDGTKKVRAALMRIKGVGQTLSLAIPRAAGISPNDVMGKISEGDVEKLEAVIKEPLKFGIHAHMINRRSDPSSGEAKHVHGADLVFTRKTDIDFMRKIRCYKGIRHELGLPVRGQRTRSSFRTGTTAGVVRKAVLAKSAPKPAPAPAPAAKAAPAAPKKEAVK